MHQSNFILHCFFLRSCSRHSIVCCRRMGSAGAIFDPQLQSSASTQSAIDRLLVAEVSTAAKKQRSLKTYKCPPALAANKQHAACFTDGFQESKAADSSNLTWPARRWLPPDALWAQWSRRTTRECSRRSRPTRVQGAFAASPFFSPFFPICGQTMQSYRLRFTTERLYLGFRV